MTATEMATSSISSGGHTFTVEQKSETAYYLIVDGQEERFGAAIVWVNNYGNPAWQIRLTPPQKWRTVGKWRQKVSIVPGASIESTCGDAADLIAVIMADMKYLDPTVLGDPVEDRASKAVQRKLHDLRELVRQQEELIASLRPPVLAAGSPGAIRSNTTASLPGGVIQELGHDIPVGFRTAAGLVHAMVSNGRLLVSTGETDMRLLPVSSRSVRISPVEQR